MGGLRERELYRSRRRGLLPRRDRPWRRSPGAASILLSRAKVWDGTAACDGEGQGGGRKRKRLLHALILSRGKKVALSTRTADFLCTAEA